jgi:hypothetical protein
MLRIVNLEEIQNLLLRVPYIVDLNEQRDSSFVSAVKKWLTELETVLKNNHMHFSANVAALRGNLISVDHGSIPTGISIKGRITKRKVREATASQSVSQAVDIVSCNIQKDVERVTEAERIMGQLVSIAKTKGIITRVPKGKNFTDALKAIWKTMAGDQVLCQGVVSVEGLVGPHDALLILDRTITANK